MSGDAKGGHDLVYVSRTILAMADAVMGKHLLDFDCVLESVQAHARAESGSETTRIVLKEGSTLLTPDTTAMDYDEADAPAAIDYSDQIIKTIRTLSGAGPDGADADGMMNNRLTKGNVLEFSLTDTVGAGSLTDLTITVGLRRV